MVLSGGKILRSPGVGRTDEEAALGEQQPARRPSSRPPALRHAVLQFCGKPVQLKQGAPRVAADTGSSLTTVVFRSLWEGLEGAPGRSARGARRGAGAGALTGARASGGRGRRAGAPGRRPRGAWRGSWRRPGAW